MNEGARERVEGERRDFLPRGEIVRDLSGVKLVLQRDLDGVAGKGDGSEGCDFGAHAGDTGNHEVGLSEIK